MLARWRHRLLAGALEAFHQNVAVAEDRRQKVQRAVQYWNNRALASGFAQWVDTVMASPLHMVAHVEQGAPDHFWGLL